MSEQNIYDSLSFSIKNSENSFYTILFYSHLYEQPNEQINLGLPYNTYGIPWLYSFSPKNLDQNKQKIFLPNYDRRYNISKTISFNSLNCEIEVFESGDIHHIDNKTFKYGHFFHSMPGYEEYFFYNITIY